ncbi:MAG: pyridoxamine 5'-phosphate oxidase family protein [Oscillospiraceae bacterium]|nr:pyridoxamine 5'-phosphate oxidase family protein [Oscillospiraceae bacterium]
MEFRPMRRAKQQLSQAECDALLREQWRGVLALAGDGGYPYAVPLDFLYDAQARKFYFHCAKEGHKLDAIRACAKASFCVVDGGVQRADHWSKDFRSVIAFGTVRVIEDGAEKDALLRRFGAKFIPTGQELERELANAAARANVLELTVEHMTGKRVNES